MSFSGAQVGRTDIDDCYGHGGGVGEVEGGWGVRVFVLAQVVRVNVNG